MSNNPPPDLRNMENPVEKAHKRIKEASTFAELRKIEKFIQDYCVTGQGYEEEDIRLLNARWKARWNEFAELVPGMGKV